MFRLGLLSGSMQFSMTQIHYYEWKRCKDDVDCEQEHFNESLWEVNSKLERVGKLKP